VPVPALLAAEYALKGVCATERQQQYKLILNNSSTVQGASLSALSSPALLRCSLAIHINTYYYTNK
jgi:hypothetical protein